MKSCGSSMTKSMSFFSNAPRSWHHLVGERVASHNIFSQIMHQIGVELSRVMERLAEDSRNFWNSEEV